MFNFKKQNNADSLVSPYNTTFQMCETEYQDNYRIGYDINSKSVTLTTRTDNNISTTLYITPYECERLIRMLRAAYPIEDTGTEKLIK